MGELVDELFGSLATRGGYTPAEIWAMDFDDAQMLVDYWARVPPIRELVSIIAQLIGWEIPSPALVEGDGASAAIETPGEFED